MSNTLRSISKIIYRLKRQYGLRVIIYRPTISSNNIQTGKVETSYTPYTIKRAAVLPAQKTRAFVYDLSFIAANKNFTYGGFFDKTVRWMIIDRKDLPKNFELERDDIMKFSGDYYVVNEIIPAEDDRAYLVKATSLESIPEITKFRINVSSNIKVSGGTND